jgi:hypothetical protein
MGLTESRALGFPGWQKSLPLEILIGGQLSNLLLEASSVAAKSVV